jgi:hypothetical protein
MNRRRALVLCLGDVGRSPRMQYHSLSLADVAGFEVDLVGYPGTWCSGCRGARARLLLMSFVCIQAPNRTGYWKRIPTSINTCFALGLGNP